MLHGGRIFCKTDKSADCEEYYSKMGEPLKYLRGNVASFANLSLPLHPKFTTKIED
jgi:hypothetical protein